jgi:AbiU2
LDAALLCAAKVFDTHRNSLTLRAILRYAEVNKGGLSAVALREVERILRDSDSELTRLESSLKAVRTRRNKLIAHLDPAVVSNPEEIAKQSQITVDDLQNVFIVAWRILNGISVLYWDLSASLRLIDVDDFEHALNLIEREKHRQLAEYEAKYGPFPGG